MRERRRLLVMGYGRVIEGAPCGMDSPLSERFVAGGRPSGCFCESKSAFVWAREFSERLKVPRVPSCGSGSPLCERGRFLDENRARELAACARAAWGNLRREAEEQSRSLRGSLARKAHRRVRRCHTQVQFLSAKRPQASRNGRIDRQCVRGGAFWHEETVVVVPHLTTPAEKPCPW